MANNMQVKMGTLENPQGGNAAGIIVQAATQKQGPTNKQLTVTLDAIRESVHNHKVTGQYAQRAQKDLEAVILHSKQLLEEKNSNDILQQLFLHIHQANMEARAKAKAEAAAKPPKTAGKDSKSKKDDKTSKAADKTKQKDQKGKDKNKGKAEEVSGKASKDGKKTKKEKKPDSPAFASMKTLIRALANSSEFRALLVNLVELAKSTAQMSGERVKKHEPTKVFDPLSTTVQTNLKDVVGASGTPAMAVETTAFQPNPNTIVIAQTAVPAPALATSESRDNIGEAKQIGLEVKDAALQTKDRARTKALEIKNDFVAAAKEGKLVDKAKLEEIKTRADKLWTEILNKPELAKALRALMDVLDERWKSVSIMGKAEQAFKYMQTTSVATGPQTAKAAPKLTLADQIWMDFRLLLAQWTGAKEIDTFFNTCYQLMLELNNDKEANRLMKDFRKFVDRTIDEPSLAKNAKHQAKPAQFFDRTVEVLTRLRHNDKLDLAMTQAKALLLKFKNDPLTTKLRSAWNKLAADMVLNEEKRIDFMVTKEALLGLQGMLGPLLRDQFALVPVPAMSGTSDMIDWSFSNLVIPSWKAIPAHINIKAEEIVELDVKSSRTRGSSMFAKLRIEISNLEIDVKNVHFKYNKKTGFPRLQDEGDVDLCAGGPQTKLTVNWEVHIDKNRITFRTRSVKFHLDKLSARFHHVRHNMLYPMALGMFNARIKSEIEKAVTQLLIEKLKTVNQMLDKAVHKAQQGLSRLPGKLDAALRKASIRANHASEVGRRNARKARKQLRAYKLKATEVVDGAVKPFIDNKGMPLAERAKIAGDNVKAAVPTPKKSRKSKRSLSKKSVKPSSSKLAKPAAAAVGAATGPSTGTAAKSERVSARQAAASSSSSSASDSDSEASTTSTSSSVAESGDQLSKNNKPEVAGPSAQAFVPLVHSEKLARPEEQLLSKDKDKIAGGVSQDTAIKTGALGNSDTYVSAH
eukprot:TRINITY_DN5000_c0_g1_i2.p1 TRINITY_DN5000_c0_g1~~TRINITY_DN5000_c0_g1_i2.p1  ORF type:complete len:975 (-),score=451.84 TRINITY_DN5000_c0_g1_i2:382-3306(-)